MKKLITIITLFATATLGFADETKTAEQVLLEGFNAITLEEGTTLKGSKARKALDELREAYLEGNIINVTALATATITAINSSEDALKVEKDKGYITKYYINRADLIADISFKVATAVNIQSAYLSAKGITYSNLVSSGFVYDGINIDGNFRNSMIIANKDYTTSKKYVSVLFQNLGGNGVNFISGYLLDMTDSTSAYEESKFWENVALKGDFKNKASVLKAIQDVQDILYLRVTRDNKIQ